MSGISAVDNLIEAKLLELHTAFMARVISTSRGTARIQPLSLIKQYGEQPKQQAIIENVPILKSVYKIELYEVEFSNGNHPSHKHGGHVRLIPIEKGDIVYCLCADRDITATQNGTMALPSIGRHEIKDAVIIGVQSLW